MSILTVMPSGKSIEVAEGTTLLAALLGADIAIPHKCEGQANAALAISTCRKVARAYPRSPARKTKGLIPS